MTRVGECRGWAIETKLLSQWGSIETCFRTFPRGAASTGGDAT
jgi:hypothetical protein